MRRAPGSQPGSRSPSRGGRAERPRAPVCEDVEHLTETLAVLGELVDPGRRGRLELPATDDSALLERLQPRGEDVRAAAVEPRMEIRVAELVVLEELANDEQRPALAHEVEGVRHRAVLRIAPSHAPECSGST